MKKINTLTMMILLTYSFSIAQELEVEGDLIVTGTIESVTIDSMQAEIDSLEAEMASMHVDNQLETRVYELNDINLYGGSQNYTIEDLTGYNLSYGLLNLVKATGIQYTGIYNRNIDMVFDSGDVDSNNNAIDIYLSGTVIVGQNNIYFISNNQSSIDFDIFDTFYFQSTDPALTSVSSIIISITAQFPD